MGTCLVLSIIDSGATCLGLQNPAIDSGLQAVSRGAYCLNCTSVKCSRKVKGRDVNGYKPCISNQAPVILLILVK